MPGVAIQLMSEAERSLIESVAVKLSLPIVLFDRMSATDEAQYDFLLCYQQQRWSLKQTLVHRRNHGDLGELSINFSQGAVKHRLLFGGGKGQIIAKAIGVPQKKDLRVLDCTAGLGRDAFVLASLGCHVYSCEQNALIHFLLEQARFVDSQHDADIAVAQVLARMHSEQVDALHFMQTSCEQWDVIFLDPMFPFRKKSAKVKKEMQYLHALLNDQYDVLQQTQLLNYALQMNCYRVVVKRPTGAPAIEAQRKPSYSLNGKSTRFDVYANKSFKAS